MTRILHLETCDPCFWFHSICGGAHATCGHPKVRKPDGTVPVITDLDRGRVTAEYLERHGGHPLPEWCPLECFPKVVTLCGSTKIKDVFALAMFQETLKGNMVFTIGCATHSDPELFGHLSHTEWMKTKIALDHLHFEKIKLSDEILVLDVNGYIGLSTCDEIGCAMAYEKKIRWWSEEQAVGQNNMIRPVEVANG